jgi:hypothetical protein
MPDAFWQTPEFLEFLTKGKVEKTRYNLNVDDLSPAIPRKESTDILFKLFKLYPGLKVDAFVIPDWRGEACVKDYPGWIQEVKTLVDMFDLRLHHHGLNHDFNQGFRTEFSDKSITECEDIIIKAVEVWSKVGLDVGMEVFRSPRWVSSTNLLDACKNLGFKIIGLNWRQHPAEVWKRGMDVVYSNFYYANTPTYPSGKAKDKDLHQLWSDFSNERICHAHFGHLGYDALRKRVDNTKVDIRDMILYGADYVYLEEATSFREVVKNANPAVQAACQP